MNWKQFTKDYFTFTSKESVGLLVVIFLILGVWIFPKIISRAKYNTIPSDTTWMAAAEKLQHAGVGPTNNSEQADENYDDFAQASTVNRHPDNSKNELFYFDPNNLPADGWRKLGVREKTITTIQKYLTKGGHFYKAEDLKKIYGIHDDEYAKLEPYIKIATTHDDAGKQFTIEIKKDKFSNAPKFDPVEINTADTSAFIALPGIGSKLASRIVNFRDRLGGFYSPDQIGEIYGLPDSTFQKIRQYLLVRDTTVKKININTATKEELKTHPYIRWALANAIVEYRNQHGNFSSVEDLKKISLITDDVFNKVKFYLTL